MFQITKDTIISEIIKKAPATMPLFQQIGMHCMGCALANNEKVSEACAAHGVDADAFIEALNKIVSAAE